MQCASCRKAYRKAWGCTPGGVLNQKRKRAKRCGSTVEHLDWLYEDQAGCCASCVEPFAENMPKGHRLPVVDHDHLCCDFNGSLASPLCGRCIRGLLCWNCNVMLGNAKDDPKRLIRGAEYIERHSRARF